MDEPLGLDGEDARRVLVGGGPDSGRARRIAGVDVDEGDAEAVEEDGVGPLGLLGREDSGADVERRGDARADGATERRDRHADRAVGEENEETTGEGVCHKLFIVN